jgi:hypothetical protein
VVPQADGRAASTYGDLDARLGRVMPGRDEWCGWYCSKAMMVCEHFSRRSTCPPSAAVRQRSIAVITFSWSRLT